MFEDMTVEHEWRVLRGKLIEMGQKLNHPIHENRDFFAGFFCTGPIIEASYGFVISRT